MNIVIVSQCFFPDNFRINDIVSELVSQGNNVKVITGLPDYATSKVPKEFKFFKKRKDDYCGAKVIRVPIIARHSGVLFRAMNYFSFAFNGFLYASFCKKKDIDAIFCYQTSPVFQAYPAIRLKNRSKAKLVLYCCDLWPESLKAWNVSENSKPFKIVKKMSSNIYKKCDTVAISSTPFSGYINEVCGVDEKSIKYLPQHSEDIYSKISGKYEENDCVDFLFAGNIGSVQNIDCIIKAIPQIITDKNFHVHIVGDGSELEACKSLASKLEITDKITFHGRFPVEEMEQFYIKADCFLLTLRGGDFIGKTLPAKAQGYLSAGKPIVAAIDGAGFELIKEADCGLCVYAGDEKGLALSMQEVICDIEKFKHKGKNGRAFYENNFTKEIFIKNLIKLLK